MIRVGIFFGGKSREREISFAGGRTVYDNLDKALFEPIPLFVDSLGRITLLNWSNIYKGTIRDFFPGTLINNGKKPYQLYAESLGQMPLNAYRKIQESVGKPISWDELPNVIDIGFLTLHGPYGEDGTIQGILEWLNLPYTGSGIFPSAFGINKILQRKMLDKQGFKGPRFEVISREDWQKPNSLPHLLDRLKERVGFPCVFKAPHQGSSIGVSIVNLPDELELNKALLKSFFLLTLSKTAWNSKTETDRLEWINELLDVRTGIGLPVTVFFNESPKPETRIYLVEELVSLLDSKTWETVLLEPDDAEDQVLVEEFIEGKEFSCIVIEGLDGSPIALPPTEIIKFTNLFDYRSKYLPGVSRKITPIEIPDNYLKSIREACERMYKSFGFQVYARLDGFVKADGTVILNDPNTTSGMLPSSFFFHQSAEIGLNPSQFLTFIIHQSIKNRMKSGKQRGKLAQMLESFDVELRNQSLFEKKKIRVGVIMGGYSTERHISMESGRNIFEKLSASEDYIPVPFFLTGSDEHYSLFRIPVKFMLKDNADDVKKLVENLQATHPYIAETIDRAKSVTAKFASNAIFNSEKIPLNQLGNWVDQVFIALHGRPGEDGSLQAHLDELGIPYNGSGVESSRKTINKFETNALLRKNGILVANHSMVYKSDWLENREKLFGEIEEHFEYPFIAKPADDGCSSAVKKIKDRRELEAFCELMFRKEEFKPEIPSKVLNLKPNEEFPQKSGFLIETLIGPKDSAHFLEITGGMITRLDEAGKRTYEVFEPSETLASGEVLSLEEKFLAGEGQNITPARFHSDESEQRRISAEVRRVLERTARILNVEGYCRIDAFVRIFSDGRVETIIIEINSLPGMTPATCIFHQAAIANLKPIDFIDGILKFGKIRQSSLQNL